MNEEGDLFGADKLHFTRWFPPHYNKQIGLEHYINESPVSKGELLTIYHETHSGNNYMLIFPFPNLKKEREKKRIIVGWNDRGEINRDGETLHLLWLEGPRIEGYIIKERPDHKILPSEKTETYRMREKIGDTEVFKEKLILHSHARAGDKFIVADGLEGLSYLMTDLAVMQYGMSFEHYGVEILKVLEELC